VKLYDASADICWQNEAKRSRVSKKNFTENDMSKRKQKTSKIFGVSRETAAHLFEISAGTFDKWVEQGWMPEGVKVGATKRWDFESIEQSWNQLAKKHPKNGKDDGINPFDNIIG
jgi:predicted DNA-binding transcriptional regulator AlpA